MARRSQCSSAGDNPLDPNYLPPHYREEYRLAIDALVEEDLEGYYQFLQNADVVDFLSTSEIQYIQSSVQAPRQSIEPEQHFLDIGTDGSSGTYWPIHSDLDVPGLHLGWPQLNPFLGPTEVTTLNNPPEPDMPSIKEQARRLIKNAQQVIAIVMDVFTDVDMFAAILDAAMRNVAVYILLDEQNAHHFINMVSNCRVDLQSIRCLCVRTVSGSTYQCRSGKSFRGQVLDRFLLTDCRAVLSGNYSFMWSFEKLHRCMAHLFLGQLVTTFDEEFRILFAQSQPLVIENALAPMEDVSLLYKRQYPNTRTLHYKEPKKFSLMDMDHSDEWGRHSSDERLDADWRTMALKRQDSLRGHVDMYSRYGPQQSRLDPCFDQGPARIPMMDNPAFKRHSYAEGVQGRHSFPFLQQQGMPDPELQGKHFLRGQQPFPGPGPEADYSGYDKFWNQDFYSADQFSEPGLPPDAHPPDNFDPVFNYLSSTRNLDSDQSSEKFQPAADLPFSSSYPRRPGLGQPYVCQTSPTPSSSADQKPFFLDPTADRKDPMVKRGLRDWRISSFLSAYEDPAEEGLPLASDPQVPNPIQQIAASTEFVVPKIPNVREFKVPVIPKASQVPNYAKTTTLEQPKKLQDEAVTVPETKTTQRPSETFSMSEGEKMEEAEAKELKSSVLRREDSFRRNYNTAMQRSSRLRSSLIFSSLEQQQAPQDATTTDQSDESSEKSENELMKLPFVSHVLGQRRSAARDPFDWSRSNKSSTFDNPSTETPKADDKASSKEEPSENPEAPEPIKQPEMKRDSPSASAVQSEAEPPKTGQPVQPSKPLLTNPLYVDMNDPDQRLIFFKQLAAKRKAAKAAEAEKKNENAPVKAPPDLENYSQKEKPAPDQTPESDSEGLLVEAPSAQDSPSERTSTKASQSAALFLDTNSSDDKKNSVVISDSQTLQSCSDHEAKEPADSEPTELDSESVETFPVSAERSKFQYDTSLSVSPVKESINPPTPRDAILANVSAVAQYIDEIESNSVNSRPVEVSTSPMMDMCSQKPKPVLLDPNAYIPAVRSEPQDGSGISSNTLEPSSSSDRIDAQISASTTAEVSLSNTVSGDSSSIYPPNTLFPNDNKTDAQDSVASLLQESSSSAEKTTRISEYLSNLTSPESAPEPMNCGIQSAAELALIFPDRNPSSSQPTSETSCAELPATEKGVSALEKDASGLNAAEECSAFLSCKDGKSHNTAPDLMYYAESSLPGTASQEDVTAINAYADTHTHVRSEATSSTSLSGATSSPHQEIKIPATPPCHLNLSDLNATSNAETVNIAPPLTDSDQSLLPPAIEKTETDMSATVTLSDKNFISSKNDEESEMFPVYPSTQSPRSQSDSTSKAPAELDLLCKTSTSESHALELPLLVESSITEPGSVVSGETKPDTLEDANKSSKHSTEESVSSDKTNDQIKQSHSSENPEVLSKQAKLSQARYHSSTVNVLSSSNLRDDTKLLLEQISANCQSRSETAKESPVTDDEKEDEADKNAKEERGRGIRTFGRGPPKSSQEREKLLEKIQIMRKERKVYSRFEIGP